MAFWNVLRAVADHETKAVRAAIACRAAIPELADAQAPQGGDDILLHILIFFMYLRLKVYSHLINKF